VTPAAPRFVSALLVAAGTTAAIGSTAHAGGLFLPGVGPQAQARAGAFIAKADDPSALAVNPAGLGNESGTHLLVGANLVDFWLRYNREGRYETSSHRHSYEAVPYPTAEDTSVPAFGVLGFQVIPLVAGVTDFSGKLPIHLAGGLFAPQGYPHRRFERGYDLAGTGSDLAPAPQRYDVGSQEVTALLPSLALAYSPTPWLEVGGRLSAGIVSLKSRTSVWALRNYEEAAEKDGTFAVSVSDNFVPTFGFGALVHPAADWDLGVSYAGPMRVHATGTGQAEIGSDAGLAGLGEVIEPITDPAQVRCGVGGTIASLTSCVDLTIPQTLGLGARWVHRVDGNETGDVELDVVWEDWSAGSNYEVTVDGRSGTTGLVLKPTVIRHGLQDVISVRLGGAWGTEALAGRIEVRGGVAYDTRAAPISWTRVDLDGADRLTLTTGLAYTLGRFRVEIGGGWVVEPSRRVPVCAPPDGPSDLAPGCLGNGAETPVDARRAPDPGQPLLAPEEQVQSPFNAGRYASGYYLLSLGLSTWF
jgi:long-chain fatty acid transport protein